MSAARQSTPALGPSDSSAEVPRRIPAARYTDPAFFAREQARLWPAVWQMACTEDCVRRPGESPKAE